MLKHSDSNNNKDESAKPSSSAASRDKANMDVSVLEGKGTYYSGWVKYFKFVSTPDANKRPTTFFENPFFLELKKRRQPEAKENTQFWLVVNEGEVSVAKSKKNVYQTIFDTLKIPFIKPVSEGNGFKGGITNIGSFKEGDCFKVETSQAGRWNWIFCTEKKGEKDKLMMTIKKLIIKEQRSNGFINIEEPAKNITQMNNSTQASVSDMLSHSADHGITVKDGKDGYWITLQDWSTCTKFCGGGTQTYHRLCVPPKEGGAPCEGQSKLNRTCNTQECPKINKVEEDKFKGMKHLKPIISILPFSDRPQRYDKCHLKEGDLLLTTDLKPEPYGAKRAEKRNSITQVPVRVVMNEYILTAYAGLNETDKKVSFDIRKTGFFTSKRDSSCFLLKEIGIEEKKHIPGSKMQIGKAEFCPFGASINNETREEWDYDFNLFKFQCFESRKISVSGNDTDIQEELAKKAADMRLDMRTKGLSKQLDEKELESSYTQQLKDNSVKAIRKETEIEKIIEEEMKEAQEDSLKAKAQEIEKEKKKLDCLHKAIKEKEIVNQFNIAKLIKEERVEGLKKQVAETIQAKRQRLKEKLEKLKNMSNEELNKMDMKIKSIRVEMLNEINQNASRNPGKCIKLLTTNDQDSFRKERKTYCDDKMATDAKDHKECLEGSKETLMKLCCDYETDPENPDEYKKCISDVKKSTKSDADDVKFFWATPYYRTQTQFGSGLDSIRRGSGQTGGFNPFRSSTAGVDGFQSEDNSGKGNYSLSTGSNSGSTGGSYFGSGSSSGSSSTSNSGGSSSFGFR